MNNPERLPSETHKPITGYLWGGLAVLTCPCHLPILAVVLAGTTACANSVAVHPAGCEVVMIRPGRPAVAASRTARTSRSA